MIASKVAFQSSTSPKRYIWIACLVVAAFIIIITVNTPLGKRQLTSFNLHNDETSRNHIHKVEEGSHDNVNNATLGFEKIFVISLPERHDHRDRLLLASKVSQIDLEFIDGMHIQDLVDKSLPTNHNQNLAPGAIGAWRAHIDALAQIVELDLSSAMIMEDDVDWDVRLKSILHNTAVSSNAVLKDNFDTLPFRDAESIPMPQTSPYGDGWDLLWLGHCGMHLPDQHIVLQENDPTVPEDRHLHSWMHNEVTPLAKYPQHTRAIFRTTPEGTCSLAYAVTQAAARRLLYELGVEQLSDSFDMMLRSWCRRPENTCVGVLPQLFDHYRRSGPGDVDSDIVAPNPKFRETAFTLNIRWSVQMNMKKLLHGQTDYDDQYPDT